MTSGPRPVRAARGTTLTTKGWQQEAALRMLQNNLDPEVAEYPDELVVYGGTGKAARNWESFDAIVRTLTNLEYDETMLVQSGKPVGVSEVKCAPTPITVMLVFSAVEPASSQCPARGQNSSTGRFVIFTLSTP